MNRHDLGTSDPTWAPGPTLIERMLDVQMGAVRRGRATVLVGVALSNAEDVADAHGPEALHRVTSELARRLLAEGPDVTLLRVSPFGGVLAAVCCPRPSRVESVQRLLQRCRGFVETERERIWPVVTIGARDLAGRDDPSAALADVRDVVIDAGRRFPGSVRWHDAEGGRRTTDRLQLTGDLVDALADPGQLALAYQPVFDLTSHRPTAAEALLRWQHPTRGPVSPIDAIEAAETSGLIAPLGEWILDTALRQADEWWRRGHRLTMHVNVSPVELRSPGYADTVADALRRYDTPAEQLLLELTETDLMAGDADVLDTLDRLRRLGVQLGIDDFGTGWSSIAQLHALPVDVVKVDRALVADIEHSPASFDLLRSVLSLLGTAPLGVIAEGVENAAQTAHLRALGCRLAQGYHLGRPMPAADFNSRMAPQAVPTPRRLRPLQGQPAAVRSGIVVA